MKVIQIYKGLHIGFIEESLEDSLKSNPMENSPFANIIRMSMF